MGRHRTSNTGVSIYKTDSHIVEKKKRKQRDISIFDHVQRKDHDASTAEASTKLGLQASAAQQLPHQLSHQQLPPNLLPQVPPFSMGQMQQQQQQQSAAAAAYANAALATTASLLQEQQLRMLNSVSLAPPSPRKQRKTSRADEMGLAGSTTLPMPAGGSGALPGHATSAAAALASAMTAANYQLAFAAAAMGQGGAWPVGGVPMRRTRSRSSLPDEMPGGSHAPWPMATHPALAGAPAGAPSPFRCGSHLGGGMRMPSAGAPQMPPVPLQHSISDIAEAFNLGDKQTLSIAPSFGSDDVPPNSSSLDRPCFAPSPLRMTRSRSLLSNPGDDASPGGGHGQALAALPLQPTLSLVAEGLEALDAVQSPAAGAGMGSPRRLVGSPMRRTRSRGGVPMPRDPSVSDFFNDFT
jgi:hypothetical protein